MKYNQLILSSIVLISSSFASATVIRICGKTHNPLKAHDQAVYSFFYGAGIKINTTTLRSERKYVVKDTDLLPVVENLRKSGAYTMRDIPAPGTVNVTRTQYMPVVYWNLDGMDMALKIRFREYLSRDVNGNMTPIKGMEETMKMEAKIDHPNYPNTVVKLIVNIHRADIAKISDRQKFFEHEQELRAHLMEINKGDEALVEKFMKLFRARYESEQGYLDRIFAITEYERESDKTPLESTSSPGVKMDSQNTLDRKVVVYEIDRDGKVRRVIRPYAPGEVVVEIKTPVAMAGLTDFDVQNTRGLGLVRQFNNFADSHHVETHQKNAGKMSKIADKAEKRARKAALKAQTRAEQVQEVIADTE